MMDSRVGELLASETVRQAFLSGLLMTLWISALSAVLALGIGLVMSFGRLSPNRWVRGAVSVYVEGFRNTPLLLQLYALYRGLPELGITLSPEMCGILGLGLYTGAYVTEIFRTGLVAIPPTQQESGLALGMSRFAVFWMILLPQAIRLVLPPLTSQLISMVKNSSLLFYITVEELFQVVYRGAVDQFQPLEYFIVGAVIYMALAWTLSLAMAGAERLYDRWLIRWFLPRRLRPAAGAS
jgi:polar amino acid transport system permease protein